MKGAPGLAGRDPPKRGSLRSTRFRPLQPTCVGRPGRQTDRAARAQVCFDAGRMEVAHAAVAGDTAVWRECTAESSGAASKSGEALGG